MADQKFLLPANPAVPPQTPVFLKLVDNGDGTYSVAMGATPSSGAAIPSAQYAALNNGADKVATAGNALQVAVAVTALTLAMSMVPSIQAKDPTTGQYRTILSGTTMTSTGVTWMAVGPELTASAQNFARDIVPQTFRVVVTPTGTNPITYSAGYSVS